MGRVQTWTQSNFLGGLNLQEGIFSDVANCFAVLENYHIREGVKGLSRRPPCKSLTGDFDSDTQGMIYLNGTWYTIAKLGASVTNTVAGITVSTLFFNPPDYTGAWSLLDLRVLNGKIVAWIRHAFGGDTVTQRLFLHTWDGSLLKPTYIALPPFQDGWQHPLRYASGNTGTSYTLQSGGRDGLMATAVCGTTTDFNSDIVYANGTFVQYPDGPQH